MWRPNSRTGRAEDARRALVILLLVSNDPDFETKATDVIGLYLHPPQPAAVFCVDEKTAIQALDRKGSVLPLSLTDRGGERSR